MPSFFLTAALSIVVAISGILATAIALIISDTPRGGAATQKDGLDFSALQPSSLNTARPLILYRARDGENLPFRTFGGLENAQRILILVHGSGWHGQQFNQMAQQIAAAGAATVIVPDLRGHGATPARRGDIDYIGQLEDDLADLINLFRSRRPNAEIILGGHSSGGGLVVRFAGGPYGAMAHRFILMAPFLKHDAPTTRRNSGGWAQPAVRRIIGLSILNKFGIRLLNHLPVISFAMPRRVLAGPLGHTATTRYSYRLNTSLAPRDDYTSDLAAMRQPFLLLAGKDDEAFIANAYEPLISQHTSAGTYKILPDTGHLDLVQSSATIQAIITWLVNR